MINPVTPRHTSYKSHKTEENRTKTRKQSLTSSIPWTHCLLFRIFSAFSQERRKPWWRRFMHHRVNSHRSSPSSGLPFRSGGITLTYMRTLGQRNQLRQWNVKIILIREKTIAGTAPPTGTAGTEEITGSTAERPVDKESPGRTTGSPAREPGRADPETTFPNSTRQKI